jgi:acyl-coenzyme A synthetase/AMP-(fatty) acid ligase
MTRPQVSAGVPPGNSLPALLFLKNAFGPRRGELIEGWRKLRNEKHRHLYCSPTIVRMIKLKGKKLDRHVAYTGKKRHSQRLYWENCI